VTDLPRRLPIRALRAVFTFRVVLVAIVVLCASGFWLHWTPRFRSLAWGLTEQVHIQVGWIAVGLWIGYLVHHLVVRWGPLTSLQRILGLALTSASAWLLVTGAMLTIGRVGGWPGWVLGSHFVATFALLVLTLWHSVPAWRRLLRGLTTRP